MDKQYMEIVINLETGQIDLEGHYINHNSQCIRDAMKLMFQLQLQCLQQIQKNQQQQRLNICG